MVFLKEHNSNIEYTMRGSITKVPIPTFLGITFFDIDNISHFEASDHTSTLSLNDGSKENCFLPLKTLEHRLSKYGFYRIHKGYIINLMSINRIIKKEGHFLIMQNGLRVPISRLKKNEFSEVINQVFN